MIFVLWFCAVASLAWDSPAGANYVRLRALDAISQGYQIPITNPEDGVTWPSVLLFTSAKLDTTSPISSLIHAPKGEIYLTLQMSSGPIQRQYGQPNWGSFFSTMTPLPASALRYVAASGRSYPVTRVNPIDQTNNFSSATDDGLVDATYYFTVPISNRAGAFIIEPSRTVGVAYRGFVGGSRVPLVVGGPTRVVLHFPTRLTVVTSPQRTPTATSRSPFASGSSFASALNFLSTLLGLTAVGLVYLAVKRRRRSRSLPQFVIHNHVTPSPPPHPPETASADPVSPPMTVWVQPSDPAPPATVPVRPDPGPATSTLLVDVLGPLTLTPTQAPASDPVRAILAFLALSDRAQTLDEIQSAVWPLRDTGTDIKRSAMHNYMVEARKVVGRDHLPVAAGGPGYRLLDVDTDWARFRRLAADATSAEKPRSLVLRKEALALVRGVPFAGDTSRYFTWALTAQVVYRIVDAVTTLAHELSTDLVLADDLAGAEWALRQGLLMDGSAQTLWEGLTDVLLETADPSLLAIHWRAAAVVLGSKDLAALQAREHG